MVIILSIKSIFSQKVCTVFIQISVIQLCIPEYGPSMLESLDDAQESPEHIPVRPPADERLTSLSDPKYHTPCIQNGAQAQERRMFSFTLTSDFCFS